MEKRKKILEQFAAEEAKLPGGKPKKKKAENSGAKPTKSMTKEHVELRSRRHQALSAALAAYNAVEEKKQEAFDEAIFLKRTKEKKKKIGFQNRIQHSL